MHKDETKVRLEMPLRIPKVPRPDGISGLGFRVSVYVGFG